MFNWSKTNFEKECEIINKAQAKADLAASGLDFEKLSSDSCTPRELGLKVGEQGAKFFSGVFTLASNVMGGVGDYSQKTSESMYKGAKNEDNTTMYALSAFFSLVSVIAKCGKNFSERAACPLGDGVDDVSVSTRLSNACNAEQYNKIASAMTM